MSPGVLQECKELPRGGGEQLAATLNALRRWLERGGVSLRALALQWHTKTVGGKRVTIKVAMRKGGEED